MRIEADTRIMAEEPGSTKIPRLDGIVSRIAIAKPTVGTVRSSTISRLTKPGFGLRSASAATAKPVATNENNVRGATQATHMQRKTLLRRLNGGKKYTSSDNAAVPADTATKPPPLSTLTNRRAISVDAALKRVERPLNETETIPSKETEVHSETVVLASANDRCLTRSGTFVCEASDETQTKLLSLTHNINSPTTTVANEVNQNPQKERTFKRSLSPIYGELMSMAKRKSMHNQTGVVSSIGPSVVSTPHGSIESTIPAFTARNTLSNIIELENSMIFLDPNHVMSSTGMQSTRLIANGENSGKIPKNPTKLVYATDVTTIDGGKCDGTQIDASREDAIEDEQMDLVEITRTHSDEKTQPIQIVSAPVAPVIDEHLLMAKQRFSLGLDLTECTLDCSFELCDSSATSAQDSSPLVNYKPQNSFEMDESLGILTPDQMIEFLDSNATNTNLELPLSQPGGKLPMHKCRVDQTPSPEELPLDPVGVKTFDGEAVGAVAMTASTVAVDHHPSDAKTDSMSKSTASRVLNSFITSVTSIASLDNGYQGDGEMSRPASRGGGGDNSPQNGRRPLNDRRKKQVGASSDNENIPILRRQDPMTDSDFFTESDADDIFHRGDRRVQIIDGHLYNGQGADLFIEDRRQNEMVSSGMDSSGIYTDVENTRGDDEQHAKSPLREIDSDMSPDGSTDTIKSSSEYQQTHEKLLSPMTSAQTHQQTITVAAVLNDDASRLAPVAVDAPTAAARAAQQPNDDSTSSSINGIGTAQTGSAVITSDVSSSSSLIGTAVNSSSPCVPSSTSTTSMSTCTTEKSTKTATTTVKSAVATTTGATTAKQKKSSSNRKQSKNDTITNVAPKKHDMSSKSKALSGKVHRNRSEHNVVENGATAMEATTSTSGNKVQHVRKVTPNKWEKVMNSIAQNKAAAEVNQKNYSQVKSKVTSGLGLTAKRASPASSSSSAHGAAKIASTHDQSSTTSSLSSLAHASATVTDDTNAMQTTKTAALLPVSRQSGAVAKRTLERDSSKDSQLSGSRELGTSSPNNRSKQSSPSARSTKKRYERSLNTPIQNGFSASPKTDGTHGATLSIKPVALHKRYSPCTTIQSTNTTSSSSPSEKRAAISPVSKKSGPTATGAAATAAAANKRLTKTLTDKLSHLKETNQSTSPPPPAPKNGLNSPKFSANGDQTILLAHQRNGSKASTILGHKIMSNGKQSNGSNAKKKNQSNNINNNHSEVITLNGDCTDHHAVAAAVDVNETIDRLTPNKSQTLIADPRLIHANKGIVALSVLVQHLAFNLNAFETPALRASYEATQSKLDETQAHLDSMLTKCHFLEEQTVAKDNFYTNREKKMDELHRQELTKVETHLSEVALTANERLKALECQLADHDANHMRALKTCQLKCDARCNELETQLQSSRDKELELLQRLSDCSVTENQLRDNVLASENEFATRLQSAAARERELIDKVSQLSRQLEATELRSQELENQSKLLRDEISVLRQIRSANGVSLTAPTNGTYSGTHGSTVGGTAKNQTQMLQDEVESLRCVLELKQNEIAELRKYNRELQSAHDELPKAQLRISSLESRIEDLTIQFQAKVDEEKELHLKNKTLQESYHQEIKNRNRLSLHNEELQWKLKQNSEKFSSALTELSKSYHDQSSFLTDCKSSLYGTLLETSHDESAHEKTECFHMDDLSPPTSPVIKGVVEKSDSVSWVLEMNDEESPEALANRVVKRAGSFRSNINERSPSFKRQLSLGPNVLSQSASAASILRQHSVSPNHQCNGTPSPKQKSPRNRSYSLTTNNETKKAVRSASMAMPVDNYSKWKEPLNSRSHRGNLAKELDEGPSTSHNSRHRTDSMPCDANVANALQSNGDGLITCDTSALSSPRTELCPSLTSHSTAQKLKKCHRIKESAGETMVSAINSDDEASFESGSDIGSISGNTSHTTSPSHSTNEPNNLPHERHHSELSIDEAALMKKIVASLNSTPMEVSWSDDGDNEHYAHESSA